VNGFRTGAVVLDRSSKKKSVIIFRHVTKQLLSNDQPNGSTLMVMSPKPEFSNRDRLLAAVPGLSNWAGVFTIIISVRGLTMSLVGRWKEEMKDFKFEMREEILRAK
jgi:hypothetical protein